MAKDDAVRAVEMKRVNKKKYVEAGLQDKRNAKAAKTAARKSGAGGDGDD